MTDKKKKVKEPHLYDGDYFGLLNVLFSAWAKHEVPSVKDDAYTKKAIQELKDRRMLKNYKHKIALSVHGIKFIELYMLKELIRLHPKEAEELINDR